MPTVTVYPTGPQEQALATLRYRLAAETLGWRMVLGKEGVDEVYPERVHEGDMVLIPRDFPRFFAPFQQVLTESHSAGKPVIYDVDDLLLALPPEHPQLADYQDALGGMLYAITQADRVLVSTPLLRDLLAPFCADIVVWPTLLPDSLWPRRTLRPPEPSAPLVLGYMGGASHAPDLEMIAPVLAQVLAERGANVEIHFWGAEPPTSLAEHPQVQHQHAGWGNYAEFAEKFGNTAVADIWLAPLKKNLFNRCKSTIKFWEYSTIGGVGIYSDLEPYAPVVRDGENGLLVENNVKTWLAAINRLADAPALRLKLAQEAQKTLDAEGMLSKQVTRWRDSMTTAKRHDTRFSPSTRLLTRFSEAVQQRADARHEEALEYHQERLQTGQERAEMGAIFKEQQIRIQELEQKLHGAQLRNIVLQERSDQLEAILTNPRWRAWQRLKKIAQLDLEPLPPHQPFD